MSVLYAATANAADKLEQEEHAVITTKDLVRTACRTAYIADT